jgi:regulatory protein
MAREISCHDKAVDLLARRSHFRLELERKLRQRGYPDGEVAATLERLAERGWIDDRRTAEEFVRGRMERSGWGWRRLMSELGARGVAEETSRDVLDELYPDDDLELARRAARRKTSAAPATLARFLERRGFSRRAIVSVLREAGADGDEPSA